MRYFLSICLGLFIFGCNSESKIEKEIDTIPISVSIIRFDRAFSETTSETLPALKKEYPVFFPKQIPDSIWVRKINDTLQKQLEAEVLKQFPNGEKLQNELHSLFQHIKYYFPKFRAPTVVTTTSDVDYRNKVIVADTSLIIALDTYLGSEHPFYAGVQEYISQNMKPSQIGPDVASAYAYQLIPRPKGRAFLEEVMYFGKQLYLKDLWLPEVSDAEKIGYTEAQWKWAEENETEIWRNFIENEYLYSTDPKLSARFIAKAPFSKFYLEIDNESPGMIGRYLGWKIVRAYMENNTIEINELLQMDANVLFNKSKYKPKKNE
ncbi:gliding motility lipoprotein GldB [Cochleicola gelatinilyticus]|uniref:Gliding motility lipoprotein GldB n=1 Tax=Cochleicola gelatinilyticus TaxID=1763537 RepID=A0A167EZZ5_9FLAO|nr:gliding motility lipoprotein GldB [Cochleicola gelatinilyticus]OAB76053.1 gliding motility lipoprotein GldB [Cochleicola gelatinilyticus]